MTKEHKKLYKAGKKWCVMGITTLAVAIGALTVTGINNAEAAVVSQPTTQLAQAQTTVTNLQRQYDNQSRQLNLASQAVTLAQNNLKSAQDKAQSADGTLAAANRDVSQAQQAKQTAEKEQADAASRVQTEQDVISRENTNIRNGKQALSDAQNEQLAAQSDVDNKANAAKQTEQVAKQQQDINDQKQAAVNATDSKISQVKDQINSVNKISVSANYINAVKDNTSFTGNVLQVLNKNSYHHSQQDAQRSFDDLNNLSQNDWAELGTFAVGLLNGIRQVAGQAPLMVTDGSVKFGQDIANIYLKHQYIDQGNREASKVNAADQNGLYNFYKYYTLTGTLNRQVLNYSQSSISLGNYTRTVTSYAFTPVTMDSLKQDTYNMILDGLRDIQKARELLMSGKYAAVTGMDQQLDLLMIDDGDLDTNGGTVFGKKSYAIPTVDTAKLQGQLTELQKLKSKQSAELTVAAQALKTAHDKFAQANNALKKAKEQLATSKQEVATKQQDLTAAKNRLKVAQNALVAAQKIANGQAVKNAESRLAQVKEKQQVAQENQQVAHEQVNKLKAELKAANDKYTKLKEDRSLTHQKLLNAQEQLKRLQTGTINYIDPDGKVVKTDQVSGKVGDKVDVKISLPDGYELANKDEQIPSSITVGEDGIKTITIQVKKLPVVQTGSINYVDQDGKVIKTDTISGKVGDQINVKLSLPDGYELANKDEHIPSVITVTENGIGTINVNVKKINTTLANNEVPYDSTTISNNVNANYGYLDSYKLTENNQGQAQLIASGWHATGASNSDRYRYMIVFDNTLGHEIARQKLVPQVRSDVQRAYPNVDNSLYSGFNITIDIPNSSINHSLSLISRYSSDPNNGEGARVDHWFNSLAFNEGNQANLDGMSSNGNTLTVNGWHATNQAAGRPYHYIIAWDRNLGHEIARQKVTAVSRPDVAKAYSTVANAVNSGFSVKFNLTPQFFNDNIQFISRWTDDAAGNGNAVDYWFKPMNRTNRANLDSVTLSNGQVRVAGWHATDLSQLEPNHYLIVFDNTTGQQVASEKVDLLSSQDVKNVFGDIQTADHSRFNYTFNSLHLIPGHNYSLVSRYSADANGNGNDGAHTDSWLNMGTFQQSAYSIDHVALNRRHMTVQGWVANDNAMSRPYAYAILLQNGHEIGRQRLNLSERADVAKVYPQIYRSQYSGFNTSFDLPTASTNGLQLVLRFTDDPAGNGNSSDKWINL